MKKGMSLQEMALEVMRISESKKDYLADTGSAVRMAVGDPDGDIARLMAAPVRSGGGLVDPEVLMPESDPRLVVDGRSFRVNDNAHQQIAARAQVPLAYYRRMMADAPQLLAQNVNHWFTAQPARRMIRTLDGTARAFMSDRYRILDNDEVLESVLPVLSDLGVDIESAAVTERRLYIKALFPRVQAEVVKGDPVQAGVVISNSEIGGGSVQIAPLVYRLVCLNGAIMADSSLKKYHVGRQAELTDGDDSRRFYKDDTLLASDKAFMLQVRDTLRGAADEGQFRLAVGKMSEAAGRLIENVDPTPAVEVVKKKFSLSESERSGVLGHLIRGGDFSQWGLVNALTRTSQDVDSYDRATDLERFGGQLIDAGGRDWSEIAKAA